MYDVELRRTVKKSVHFGGDEVGPLVCINGNINNNVYQNFTQQLESPNS